MIDSGVFSSQIAPKLKDMIQDGDRDVAFYATAAFKDWLSPILNLNFHLFN